MHRDEPARTPGILRDDVDVSRHGFIRRHVYRLHEPARIVGAYRKKSCVEWPQSSRDLAEFRMPPRVAREENDAIACADCPAAPEGRVPVVGASAGEVLCRGTGDVEIVRAHALPPVQLGLDRRAASAEPGADTERGDELRVPMPSDYAPDRRDVEMVVVIVRQQHEIDRRQ